MADLAGVPVVEEVLAIGLDLVEDATVDPGGVGCEAALWLLTRIDRPASSFP